jgi:hypothetical protein
MVQEMRNAAGTIKIGINEISIKAPTEIKNMAPNISLRGIVTILATDALMDSATNTPARKAPVATDKPIVYDASTTITRGTIREREYFYRTNNS